MKKIGFYQPHLDIQGTGVSYFDYVYFNEKILGNKSIMFCDKNDHRTHPLAEQKFKSSVNVIELNGHEDMNLLKQECLANNIDALYIQKCGMRNDGRFIEDIPTFIHVVGMNNDPHGTVYAYVSKWLSQHCSGGEFDYVPYMINLPDIKEDFRDQLKIPKDALVFGRYGGPYGWNIPFVNDVIKRIVEEKDNYYFIFANTDKFIDHNRVLFVESFADLRIKRRFINTADVMIHARNEGESFGAAVGEFSHCNKPVITYINSPEKNHLTTLGELAFCYDSPEQLYRILNTFSFKKDRDWNAYKDFAPEAVMQRFKKVFIDKI